MTDLVPAEVLQGVVVDEDVRLRAIVGRELKDRVARALYEYCAWWAHQRAEVAPGKWGLLCAELGASERSARRWVFIGRAPGLAALAVRGFDFPATQEVLEELAKVPADDLVAAFESGVVSVDMTLAQARALVPAPPPPKEPDPVLDLDLPDVDEDVVEDLAELEEGDIALDENVVGSFGEELADLGAEEDADLVDEHELDDDGLPAEFDVDDEDLDDDDDVGEVSGADARAELDAAIAEMVESKGKIVEAAASHRDLQVRAIAGRLAVGLEACFPSEVEERRRELGFAQWLVKQRDRYQRDGDLASRLEASGLLTRWANGAVGFDEAWIEADRFRAIPTPAPAAPIVDSEDPSDREVGGGPLSPVGDLLMPPAPMDDGPVRGPLAGGVAEVEPGEANQPSSSGVDGSEGDTEVRSERRPSVSPPNRVEESIERDREQRGRAPKRPPSVDEKRARGQKVYDALVALEDVTVSATWRADLESWLALQNARGAMQVVEGVVSHADRVVHDVVLLSGVAPSCGPVGGGP